jgi:ABC-type histidine transport system ATPase subunit
MIFLSNLVNSANITDGEILFKESCIQCHENPAEEMMIFSMQNLKKKIYGCAGQLNLPWNEQDVDDAASYLDVKYFHFNVWE